LLPPTSMCTPSEPHRMSSKLNRIPRCLLCASDHESIEWDNKDIKSNWGLINHENGLKLLKMKAKKICLTAVILRMLWFACMGASQPHALINCMAPSLHEFDVSVALFMSLFLRSFSKAHYKRIFTLISVQLMFDDAADNALINRGWRGRVSRGHLSMNC
jgi:hypothetical protein